MGFGNTAKKNTTNTKTKKSSYVNIGTVWQSKNDANKFYISTNKDNGNYEAPGELLYRDKTTGNTYVIHSIGMFEPSPKITSKIPNLQYNLSINLDQDVEYPNVTLVEGVTTSTSETTEDEEYATPDVDDTEE